MKTISIKEDNPEDKAWRLLEEKTGLKLNERMFIRSTYSCAYKDEYPFVLRKYKKGKVECFRSEIEQLSHYSFSSQEEVILANAIFENVKENFNPNTFIQQLKFTLRILGVKSDWAD